MARSDLAEHESALRTCVRPAAEPPAQPPFVARPDPAGRRPEARGKFLFLGRDKLYVRGTTYGTFRPNADGELFPPPAVVESDFAEIAASGLNAVRTYTLPPRWLLDLALDNGLFVMVGIAWEQHVDFLDERRRARSIEERVRADVATCAGHPAVLCYSVGNEIPGQIVRWRGRRPVERFIARLYEAAKREDPDGLVTYVNYPPTEYLQLPFLDMVCFNVYLEARRDLDAYLARLHNISHERPLVMAEIGLDSRGHGERRQAETLDWQIRTSFDSGCSGAFVFAWTDDWYVTYLSESADGGAEMRDWDFGLTRRDRGPKPALDAVRTAFEESPFTPARSWPRISVVVCTFNGAKTLRSCLDGVLALDYPDFEVIVVDDGSTDSTPAIAAEYEVRLIKTPNRGLANARNTGLRTATGEIVAYVDDDASPDTHWLRYLALAFEQCPRYAGVGGPNIPPADSSWTAACIAAAPGGPTHVLVSDREAEHIPGCNMAFRRQALEDIGGFDPRFTAAGDDVDICWRLLEAGREIGFSPAALVWHEPRDSIFAYWHQQRGYGAAEAMLERKWPDRYQTDGRARWAGRLYGRGLLRGFGRWRVYYGTWGSELFQSLYSPGHGRLSSLLLGPEWFLLIAALAFVSLVGLTWTPLLFAVPLMGATGMLLLAVAGAIAAHPRSLRRPLSAPRRPVTWALVTFLHLTQPLARMRGRLRGLRAAPRSRARVFSTPVPRVVKVWTDVWQPGEQRLVEMESRLRGRGAIVARGGVYDRWDLDARHGWIGAVRIRTAIEEHGGGRQLVRMRLTPRFDRAVTAVVAMLLALTLAAMIDGAGPAAVGLAAAAAVVSGCAVRSAGEAMSSVLAHAHPPDREAVQLRRETAKMRLERT